MADPNREIAALHHRLDHLEHEIIAPLAGAVELIHRRLGDQEDPEDAKAVGKGHREWKCECCRARLGFYDETQDLMRIRVKDFHVQVKVGPGGFVEVPCRRCGHVNRVSSS